MVYGLKVGLKWSNLVEFDHIQGQIWWNLIFEIRNIEIRTNSNAFVRDQGSITPTYLHTNFTPLAPKSIRIQSSCLYLFMLLGSTGAKAARRMLMKLTIGRQTLQEPKLSCCFWPSYGAIQIIRDTYFGICQTSSSM